MTWVGTDTDASPLPLPTGDAPSSPGALLDAEPPAAAPGAPAAIQVPEEAAVPSAAPSGPATGLRERAGVLLGSEGRPVTRTFTAWRVLFLVLVAPVTAVLVGVAFQVESPDVLHGSWTPDGAMVVEHAK